MVALARTISPRGPIWLFALKQRLPEFRITCMLVKVLIKLCVFGCSLQDMEAGVSLVRGSDLGLSTLFAPKADSDYWLGDMVPKRLTCAVLPVDRL